MNNKELWQAVLGQIQFSVSKANFATWFKNTYIYEIKEGVVTVAVENSFSKEWLENKYSTLILKILRGIDNNIKNVEFVVNPEKKSQSKSSSKDNNKEINSSPQLKIKELVVDQKTNLNPHYNFDNFVVGRFNEMTQAAAWAISENPGSGYNPLFIYSGVGLGKTHLLQATGNRIKKLFHDKNVKYIPCERFVSGIVNAIKNRNISEFKKNLRKVDVLIMDDVQFFAGKEKSQEEFYHIYNFLHQSQKQILLSSDRSPKAISSLEERLKSRFEGGMIMDISIPDYETRLAILKAKCNEKDIEITNDVLEYIASNIRTNIREMEGALNRLIFFKKINNQEPDIEVTKKLLGKIISTHRKKTTYKQIIQAITEFYDLSQKDLLEETRRKEIVKPRQIAMYMLRKELNESFPAIGKKFKGKDHTTAMYSCKKISQKIEENEDLSSEINLIKQKLYSGTLGEK